MTDSEKGNKIARVLGLKRDREHRDRWATEWGSKTDVGLLLTVRRLAEESYDTPEKGGVDALPLPKRP